MEITNNQANRELSEAQLISLEPAQPHKTDQPQTGKDFRRTLRELEGKGDTLFATNQPPKNELVPTLQNDAKENGTPFCLI